VPAADGAVTRSPLRPRKRAVGPKWLSRPRTAKPAAMRHIISVLVENEFGVLAKIAGLFSGRGFNIESLCVAETTDPTVSRITLVTSGDDRVLEQITKHLNKLVNIIRVCDFSGISHVERELVLVKVAAESSTRADVLNVVSIFRGKVVDVAGTSYVLEVTGTSDKIKAFIDLLKPFGILEIVRTGIVAMYRGGAVLAADVAEEKPTVAVDAGHAGRIAREGSEADFV
jgi:acetolactate synthase I/III small subunit